MRSIKCKDFFLSLLAYLFRSFLFDCMLYCSAIGLGGKINKNTQLYVIYGIFLSYLNYKGGGGVEKDSSPADP